MKIAYSKTREQFPLSHKKIVKKTILDAVVITILSFVVWVFLVVIFNSMEQDTTGWLGNATLGIFGLLFLLIFLTYLYQCWYFESYFYDLTSDFIQIKKGPITPREITLPYERVQDVYVDQDLLDRIFGLYDVHLSSATISSGIEAHIDGVEKQSAEGLRDVILQAVQQKISKNKSADISTSHNSQIN